MTTRSARIAGPGLALGLLLLVATVNYVDRQILVILLEPIKQELRLSDTQLGLLSGGAFAVCFAIAGVPIARMAETGSRRWIITISIAIWTLFTAASGLAQGFAQLMAARILVAVAESGSGPASQSMIADLYPHGRRSTAFAILSCSLPIGVLIGLAIGGLLNDAVGWRYAFVLVGLPGIACAGILILFLKDPDREARHVTATARVTSVQAVSKIWSIPSYRLLVIAATIHLFAIAGLNQWIAAYLMRTYSKSTTEVGLWLGLIIGVTGIAATLLGGYLGDRLGRSMPQWLARLPALIVTGGGVFAIAALFAPSFEISLILFVGVVVGATAYTGPVFGAVQSLAPPHLRTTAAAFTMLLGGLIGQAGGPLLVGALSDLMRAGLGAESLRWALVAVAPLSIVAGAIFWMAGDSVRADLQRVASASVRGRSFT